MGRLRHGVALAVLVAALAGPAAVVAAPTSIPGSVPTSTPIAGSVPTTPLALAVRASSQSLLASPMARDMLDRVNAERSASGLPPMRLDDRLVLAAQHHSDDQARRGQMSHTGIDGSTPALRVDRAGYGWRTIAENVAFGYSDAAAVMAAWMASDGHRRNILSANIDLGVGLAYGADGKAYWTQLFSTPR